jgi:hypothetical protein
MDEPIDIGAKLIGDAVPVFAVAWKPGENEPVIDWNLLKQIDWTHMTFPSPYRLDEKMFSVQITDIQEAGQWGDIVFSTVKCFYGHEGETTNFMLLLGQGPGILCGTVMPEFDDQEDNEKALEKLRTELEKCLEESQQRVLAGTPAPTHSIAQWKEDGTTLGFWSGCHLENDKIVSTVSYFGSQETMGTLAQFAQAMLGDTAERFGLAP